MGYYIETTYPVLKAEQLVKAYDAKYTPAEFPPPKGKTLICVVQNVYFDAAAICHNEREFDTFNTPDGRMKDWLLMDTAVVKKLNPQAPL